MKILTKSIKLNQSEPMLKFKRTCPKCKQRMERIRRTPFQHLLSKVIPVIHVDCCGKSYTLISNAKTQQESPKSSKVSIDKIIPA